MGKKAIKGRKFPCTKDARTMALYSYSKYFLATTVVLVVMTVAVLRIESTSAFLHPLPTVVAHLNNSCSRSRSRSKLSGSSLWGRRGGGGGQSGGKNKKAVVKKQYLPSKTCVVCGRPFTWRKKWERCWDEVTCCSKSCNAERRSRNKGSYND